MEATCTLFVVFAALLAAALPASCSVTRNITTSFITDQTTGQPSIGSSPSFLCLAKEFPFYRSGNDISLYKRQASDASWVKIVSGVSPSTRYKLVRIQQENQNEDGYTLIIDNFQAADVGVYLCNVTVLNASSMAGTTTAEISLTVAPQQVRVNVTSSAEASNEGIFWYEGHAVTTACTVDLVSSTDVEVKVFYNGVNRVSDFLVMENASWAGSADAMKEPRRRITLASQKFKPVAGIPRPIECVALERSGSVLGRGNVTVALKTLPQIQCFQSGESPAYLNDLDVTITCEVLNYDWKSQTSRFSWSFTAVVSGEPTTITVDDPRVGKEDRRIVEDPQDAKRQSLLINKITSEAAHYTSYNISLLEESNIVTMTMFNLHVNKRSRSADWASSAARPPTAALCAHVLWLSLVALLAAL